MQYLLKKPILGIESSCDEMAAAVLYQGKLLAQTVSSQSIHAEYGGVVPELAARTHYKQVIPVLEATLSQAQIKIQDLGSIAVTQGPGLMGSLLVGVSFANGLGLGLGIPLLGVHHMKAHLLANWLEPPYPPFPSLGLTLSGGHTQLVWVKSPLEMTLLGSTKDDAIGEAFDKTAKMMGIPYPGGAQVDKEAQKGDPHRFSFPITVMSEYDFSFSGIKTAFRYLLRRESAEDPDFLAKNRAHLCASLQAALVKMILIKVELAMQNTGAKALILGGGVANNSAIQTELKKLSIRKGYDFFKPKPEYTTDNAAMVAITGYYALQHGQKAVSHLEPNPRMPF